MDQLLAGLRAAAEPTRLRLLILCGRAELTVTELTQILGQSQPRVSRHLKLLCEAGLERAVLAAIGDRPIGDYLDIGTGTGRLLELIGPRAQHALGVDLSREMLAVARANLERAGLTHCSVRQADMYQLPLGSHAF